MTDEYLEDDDEGADYEARAQLAELQAQVEEQQEVAEIQAQIVELQRRHGSRFSQDEVQSIGELIDDGHDPQAAYDHVAPESPEQRDAEQEFQSNLEHHERTDGRVLSKSEQNGLWESIVHDDDEFEVHDVDQREGRKAWAAELLSETFEQPEPPEQVEPLPADASAEDRKAFIEARLQGAETYDPYQSPASESGETE